MIRRHVLALLRAALTAAAVSAAAATHAEPWTVRRAVIAALEQSPDARIALARANAAQALVDQSDAPWRPQLSVQGRYNATNSPMLAFGSILNQRAFHPGIDFNHPGTIDNLNATATVSYNLYNAGRATAGRTAARAGALAANHDLQAAHHLLAAAVVRAVLNVQQSRETVAAIEATVRAHEATRNVAQARFEAGRLLKADLLGVEVQLAQTRESLANARHAAALAERTFRFVVGLEPADDRLELVPDDPSLTGIRVPDRQEPVGRPDLVALEERVRAAEAMVAAARSSRRPNVSGFASYQYDHGWRLDRGADGWMAGVAIDVNVFDGGLAAAKLRQSTAELAQAREMLRQASRRASLEVGQARLAHASALERLEVSAQTVGQAEESALLHRARFESEALLPSDLLDAETRLIDAQLRRTVAAADERLALVELRRALGLDPVEILQP
jgi:outer membrane protein